MDSLQKKVNPQIIVKNIFPQNIASITHVRFIKLLFKQAS